MSDYTDRPEFRGLMDDCLRHWSEDWPRLVLADWCDDNGEETLARLLRWDKPVPLEQRGGRWYLVEDKPEGLPLSLSKLPINAAGWLQQDAEYCVVWRGFVSEVGLTLESWEKNGKRLAKDFPLRRVWLTDREPVSNAAGCSWRKDWQTEMCSGDVGRAILPAYLFTRLAGGRLTSAECYRDYESRQLALEAASAACLSWARGEQ